MSEKSLAWKITRVLIPLMLYFIVALIVQVAVGGFVICTGIGEMDGGNYATAYHFLESIDAVISENAVLVTLITAFVMIPLIFYMMYIDELYKKIEPVNFSGYGMIAILGIMGALGVGRLVNLLPIDNILGSYMETQSLVEKAPISLQILTMVFVVPFMEELLFRGLIYNRIKDYNDRVIATFFTALLFGIYHMNLVQGIYAFIMGIVLCMVYERHKSILAPLFMHICANGVAFVAGHNIVSEKIGSILIFEIIVTLIELGLFVFAVLFFLGVTDSKKKKEKEGRNNGYKNV